MALCRFSNYLCDLYIYESAYGIECYVAAQRRVNEPEPPPSIMGYPDEKLFEWMQLYTTYQSALDRCELVRIGLSHDGERRLFDDWSGLLDWVTELQEEGYHVPDWVIEEIRGEADHQSGSVTAEP